MQIWLNFVQSKYIVLNDQYSQDDNKIVNVIKLVFFVGGGGWLVGFLLLKFSNYTGVCFYELNFTFEPCYNENIHNEGNNKI